jgi:hypothetical protein
MPIEPGRTSVRRPTAPPRRPRPSSGGPDRRSAIDEQPGTAEQREAAGPADEATDPAQE